MPGIHVITDGDHERTGRQVGTDRLPVIHTTADWTVDALEHGMQSGATSLMAIIPVNVDGVDALVLAETSLNVWMMAATVLAAQFRDEVEQPGWALLSGPARALLFPRFLEAVTRVFPDAPADRAAELVTMILDGFGAGAPESLAGDG